MPEMPTPAPAHEPGTFQCLACHYDKSLDWLCPAISRDVFLWCIGCCGCETHHREDVEGTVILAWTDTRRTVPMPVSMGGVIGMGNASPPLPVHDESIQLWWADQEGTPRLHRRREDGTVELLTEAEGAAWRALAEEEPTP